MFGMSDLIKSKADAMKFAIAITAENVYQDGRIIPTMHLSDAKRVYEMFDELDLPDYQRDELNDTYYSLIKTLTDNITTKSE